MTKKYLKINCLVLHYKIWFLIKKAWPCLRERHTDLPPPYSFGHVERTSHYLWCSFNQKKNSGYNEKRCAMFWHFFYIYFFSYKSISVFLLFVYMYVRETHQLDLEKFQHFKKFHVFPMFLYICKRNSLLNLSDFFNFNFFWLYRYMGLQKIYVTRPSP